MRNKKLWKNFPQMFSESFLKMYPITLKEDEYIKECKERQTEGRRVKNITIIVTQDCQLRCSYCYQHAKNCYNAISKETARKIVDLLFESDLKDNKYLNPFCAEAIVLDFIGGEPLLEIELIEYFLRYFRKRAVELNHRWAINYMISMSTNGIAFNTPKVQKFIKKNRARTSIGITVDGNKELHDTCRRFPNGEPSYDIVANSIKRHQELFKSTETKLTLAPANIEYLFSAIRHLYENLHLDGVFANCIFEEGWKKEHAVIFYQEMKKIADWMIDNNIEKDYFCSLFSNRIGTPMTEEENNNYCGGTGSMLSFTADGRIQPCLRYTDFNLNYAQPELVIGTLEDGIGNKEEHKELFKMLDSITRRSQSTDECFYCPIASGCAWCSAHNYETFGTPNKRTTFICIMHKARVLANRYYWQKIYKKYGLDREFEFHVPKEWALEIISEDEYEMLKNLS